MAIILFEEGMLALDPLSIDHFKPTAVVATCYIAYHGKFLLLKRAEGAALGKRWCMPGGKLEKNETPLQGVIREVGEETGIMLHPDQVDGRQTIYMRVPRLASKQDYLLHLFKTVLPISAPSGYTVTLNKEHSDYLWADLQEAHKLNLVAGGKEILASLHTTTRL